MVELLTARETQALHLVAMGCSQREVATRMGVGRSDARRALDRVLLKLNAATLPQAVALAAREKLLNLDMIPGGPNATNVKAS